MPAHEAPGRRQARSTQQRRLACQHTPPHLHKDRLTAKMRPLCIAKICVSLLQNAVLAVLRLAELPAAMSVAHHNVAIKRRSQHQVHC